MRALNSRVRTRLFKARKLRLVIKRIFSRALYSGVRTRLSSPPENLLLMSSIVVFRIWERVDVGGLDSRVRTRLSSY